ncbi:MAG: YeeE/YedE family protein [Saprospiraceae bacterium]|nr:YeeE/YedE family protein [Bacteroidia bacterium]NNF21495.1 YeeE/YedE family protein [Saprospiraceae bacterium]NNK90265.1 YeeE/YedE family protein [Saprospiraceae bacterium]
MKYFKFLLVGILFGIMMAKAEIISWFRIYEMFRFESFHMYGIIGSAVVLGIIIIQIIKRTKFKSIYGEEIVIPDKDFSYARYIIGGIIFGLGWAMVGACPGPMFVLIGYGYYVILLVVLGALIGTFVYGVLRNKLPH